MYLQFKEKMHPYQVFSIKDIKKEFPKFDNKALVFWQKKGYIIKIKNGYYCFSDYEKEEFFLFFVANKIYSPSYISLEIALSYYNVIPENTFITTSISTLKTNTVDSPVGVFTYKHVKPHLFFGYQLLSYKTKQIKIATLEKATLDYLYLNSHIADVNDIKALRWNKEKLINMNFQLFKKYQILFNSKALNKRVKQLLNYLYA